MTGAEWVYFLQSVDATAYPTKGAEGFSHHLRKQHPSPKPPQLMRRYVEFFSQEGGLVLDPFMGVGGTLLGCGLCGRRGVGIDLSDEYIAIYHKVCAAEKLPPQTTLHGDSRHLVDLAEGYAPFDLILTDPPYGDMMARAQTGENKKRTGEATATPFTDQDRRPGQSRPARFFDCPARDFDRRHNTVKAPWLLRRLLQGLTADRPAPQYAPRRCDCRVAKNPRHLLQGLQNMARQNAAPVPVRVSVRVCVQSAPPVRPDIPQGSPAQIGIV